MKPKITKGCYFMKKVLVLMLVAIMVLSSFMLVGCDSGKQSDDGKETTTTTTQNSTTATTLGGEQSTTLPNGEEQSTTVADGEQSTTVTTAIQDDTTTTTKKPTTTTTTKKTTTTTKQDVVDSQQGVINQKRTETVYSYLVDEDTFSVGVRQERTIEYKGTIKIGNTAATSGSFANVGVPFNDGLEAYINAINFDGGIGGDYEKGRKGYYIEFIHYDDKFDDDKGLAYTKRLVEQDEVFALVGHFGSPTVGATIDYIKQKGVIACYFASGLGELYNTNATSTSKGSTLFPVQPIYTTEGRITVARILQKCDGAKKIGVVYVANSDVGVGIRDGAKAQVKALGADYECVISEATAGSSNFTSAVNKVADCDAIIVAAAQKDTIGIINSLIKNGIYKPVFTSYSVATSQTLVDVKSEYDKLSDKNKFPIYSNSWLSGSDMDSYLDFCYDVIAYEGDSETISNTYAMTGWIAASVFCEGLERVIDSGKEITTANYVKAMESDEIDIEMTGGAELDYSNGYRLGTTTMCLLENTESCTAFTYADDMKDFMKFIKTGNVNYIK